MIYIEELLMLDSDTWNHFLANKLILTRLKMLQFA